MKKIIGISVLSLLAIALLNKLKNKKAALENFKIGNLELQINTARSKQAFWTKLFYKLKIEIVNDETESIDLLGLNLDIFFRNIKLANLNKKSSIKIEPNSSKVIEIESYIVSINIITSIVEYLADQKDIVFNVKGYLESNVGKLPVDIVKKVI